MLNSNDPLDASSKDNIEQSARKSRFREHFDDFAARADEWRMRHRYFYESDQRYLQFLIPENVNVLILGCGTGSLFSKLKPLRGVGIDISERMVERARINHPDHTFFVGDVEQIESFADKLGGPFDYIVLADTLGYLDDAQDCLAQLESLCHPDTRLIIAEYSDLWEPLLRLGEMTGVKIRQPPLNYIGAVDIENLLDLTDYEMIKRERRMFIPYRLFGLGSLINNTIATLPILQIFCLRFYTVARPVMRAVKRPALSATVLVPCRNEKGNIENAIKRLPVFCEDLEIIFVEGNSSDNTYEECLRVQEVYTGDRNIKVFKQPGKGKGDAVRKGFDEAAGDVLIILDADLTVPPEDIPKFYNVVNSGKADFVNGTRLVYPMEREAMRFLNYLANRSFAFIFSFLLNARLTDTLCGTKVLRREGYIEIVRGRAFFGDFDPFGDFDLIFGASKLNMKILEVPVHYKARSYGRPQISRFKDGFELLKMVVFAFFKMKVH